MLFQLMTVRSCSLLSLIILASCAATAFSRDLSLQRAAADAEHDIRSGHMKIHLAGGRLLYAVGVEDRDKVLVANLPHVHTLPSGCTNPSTLAAVKYANICNR